MMISLSPGPCSGKHLLYAVHAAQLHNGTLLLSGPIIKKGRLNIQGKAVEFKSAPSTPFTIHGENIEPAVACAGTFRIEAADGVVAEKLLQNILLLSR